MSVCFFLSVFLSFHLSTCLCDSLPFPIGRCVIYLRMSKLLWMHSALLSHHSISSAMLHFDWSMHAMHCSNNSFFLVIFNCSYHWCILQCIHWCIHTNSAETHFSRSPVLTSPPPPTSSYETAFFVFFCFDMLWQCSYLCGCACFVLFIVCLINISWHH